MTRRHIPEAEFNAFYRRALQQLSDLIVGSGIPIKAIARGSRVKRDTVYSALKGRPIRVDSATRIVYFIQDAMADNEEVVNPRMSDIENN